MKTTLIRTFTPQDCAAVFDLQQTYSHIHPGVPVFPGEMYLSPAFHGGEDVFCAFDADRLVAYAVTYVKVIEEGPADLTHMVWTEVKAHPDCAEPECIKDLLLEQVLQRARALTEPYPGRAVRVNFEYHVNETAAMEYVLARGFQYTESVFMMRRDLHEPIPDFSAPAGIAIQRWQMESEDEQRAYVAARSECFPEAPVSLEEWQYFMTSPIWAGGTSIAAFDGSALAGNVAVYWDEAEITQSGVRGGCTEFIFVRPGWRGMGIARAMITEGMRYLIEHGMQEARLGVRTLNENALGLYRGLGYEVTAESRFYMKEL